MNGKKRLLKSATLSIMSTLAPTLAAAATSGESMPGNNGFHALSNLQGHELSTLSIMSDHELSDVQGEFFNFGFNIAIAPQFNICIFCNGVNQSNIAMIFGFNSNP